VSGVRKSPTPLPTSCPHDEHRSTNFDDNKTFSTVFEARGIQSTHSYTQLWHEGPATPFHRLQRSGDGSTSSAIPRVSTGQHNERAR